MSTSRWCAIRHSRAQRHEQIQRRAQQYFGDDQNAPFAYEPSGTDFLSPTLAEADLMRRVLTQEKLAAWLSNFLGEDGEEQMLKHLLFPITSLMGIGTLVKAVSLTPVLRSMI